MNESPGMRRTTGGTPSTNTSGMRVRAFARVRAWVLAAALALTLTSSAGCGLRSGDPGATSGESNGASGIASGESNGASGTAGTTGTPSASSTSASASSTSTPASGNAAAPIVLSFIQNKVEVSDIFKQMGDAYMAEHPGVRLETATYGGGEDYSTRITAMIQAGNPPDLFTNEGYAQLLPWLAMAEDLTDQPWVARLYEGAADPVTVNGRIYGFPEAYEGFGFAYNRTLFKQAGITEEPDTLPELTAACKQLEAAGIRPFVNTYAEWWVLGSHNISLPLGHQEDPAAFIDAIAAGTGRFADGKAVDGWLRLLDLTIAYGQRNATSEGNYATTVAEFAAGNAAMMQQGNWIQPLLDKLAPDIDAGFLPMPLDDTPDRRIYAGVPNFIVVNRDSPRRQAALDWLEWLVSSETGQRFLTERLQYLPAFRDIDPGNPAGLNRALADKLAAGETYTWNFPRLPSGSNMNIAYAMLRYLDKESTPDALFAEIDSAIRTAGSRQRETYGDGKEAKP